MSHADLTAARWRELSDESAIGVARAITRENGLELVGVHDHEYAGRRQRLALFERDGMRFSLVPADRVSLGYDGAKFVPSPQQAADFTASTGEHGVAAAAEFVDAMTSPVRVTEFAAMLVAVEAMAMGATAVPLDDPEVQALAAKAGGVPSWTIMSWRSGDSLRVEVDERGQPCHARVVRRMTHAQAVREAAERGMRPTSPDEWEYACGAGATTLFRWGDDYAGMYDGYPDDQSAGLDRQPNLWGLVIGQDPYEYERTSDREVPCGGDGGGAAHGGEGVFIQWLTLATAYRDPAHVGWFDPEDDDSNDIRFRLVVPLV
ncbi:hypothetical protein [Actinocrispum wychmicini]|uniref:Formylglycine-generating enzyme required for sulfatase activity n=1 Tax=Actinocrispum wychmicini TaxID=1213861 RepID=A0A4R2JXB2_9PSEU|nr:hypothetical protein [Actinocrispum wychmicini]TCO64504.1 formylglycine-generating enzyme required for sulfatase activity [Actinocrispum wychmicini]